MAKRGRLEIMRDILNVIRDNKNSIRVTPLLRKSNLSTARFKEYHAELLERGLVKELGSGEEKRITLTDNGFQFLEKYLRIVEFVEEFGL